MLFFKQNDNLEMMENRDFSSSFLYKFNKRLIGIIRRKPLNSNITGILYYRKCVV